MRFVVILRPLGYLSKLIVPRYKQHNYTGFYEYQGAEKQKVSQPKSGPGRWPRFGGAFLSRGHTKRRPAEQERAAVYTIPLRFGGNSGRYRKPSRS